MNGRGRERKGRKHTPKVRAGSTETGLNFIGDAYPAMLPYFFVHRSEKAGGQRHLPTAAKYRLVDERREAETGS